MSATEEWMDYAERLLRRKIEAVPDGVYDAPQGWLEDDGKNFGVPFQSPRVSRSAAATCSWT